jgi:ribosomal RNA-processing protein 17
MPPPSKKRKTSSATPLIAFDPTSRAEYLTGFRKRKQARIKASQEKFAERARQDKIRERAETKQRRKEEVEEHVRAVNEASGILDMEIEKVPAQKDEGEEGDWEGFGEVVPILVNRLDEYVDEEKYTTVTVEEVNVSRVGLEGMNGDDSEPEDQGGENTEGVNDRSQQKGMLARKGTKPKRKSTITKKRKQTFKYETKSERKVTRTKQKSRNSSQAKLRKESSSTRDRR